VHVSPSVTVCGNVEIGSNTFIGANSVIIQNIKIGDNCVVGAGSVIYRNIENNQKVVQRRYNRMCDS